MLPDPFPSFIPPGAFSGESPLYDPNGPVGQIHILSSDGPLYASPTIGQLDQSEYPPLHGWQVAGESMNSLYAVPDYSPPPAVQFAMFAEQLQTIEQQAAVQQQYLMTAMLLMMF